MPVVSYKIKIQLAL